MLNITVRVARAARSRSEVDCHRDLVRGGGPGQEGWSGTSREGPPDSPRGPGALQTGTLPRRRQVPRLSERFATSARQGALPPNTHDCKQIM